MLITDKKELKKYYTQNRVWQGIPGIEITKKGRIFAAFYSGATNEEIGNFVALVKSEDGVNFTEPIAVAYKENYRCYDECVWIDPLGRLWFIWALYPEHAVYGVICDNPDADELEWGEEFLIGHDVMMNKPTVLSTGEWLFPISVWGERVWTWMPERRTSQKELGAFVYKTIDQGKTFEKLGGVVHYDHAYDEHMVLELSDGRLAMYTRTMSGIGISYSYDRGLSWTDGTDSKIGGPNSRFFISRLKSGRILLINHHNYSFSPTNVQGRNNLTAFLSEDEGKTWKYKLLLDERDQVSYPDAVEGDDGFIYITYDRERGCGKKTIDEAYSEVREILYSKICEEDIMKGEIVNPESKLKIVISRLGKCENEEIVFGDGTRQKELVPYLMGFDKNAVVDRICRYHRIENIGLVKEEWTELDSLFEIMENSDNEAEREDAILKALVLLAFVPTRKAENIAERAIELIESNISEELSEDEIAEKLGVGKYQLKYSFKRHTAISVSEYRNASRLTKAKRMLRMDDVSLNDVARISGFGDLSVMIESFIKNEKISPSEYRNRFCN